MCKFQQRRRFLFMVGFLFLVSLIVEISTSSAYTITNVTLSGPTSGITWQTYTYSVQITTEGGDGQAPRIVFDWGDGGYDNCPFLDPYARSRPRVWIEGGTYNVRASADGIWSNTLTVTILGYLANPTFDHGDTSWIEYSKGGYFLIEDMTNRPPVYSGIGCSTNNGWVAWLGGYSRAVDYIYQEFTIPTNATQAYFDFWYLIETAETTNISSPDKLKVQILDTSNRVLGTLLTLSNRNKTGGQWVLSPQFNIVNYRGKTIRLRFYATNNLNSKITNFFIERVRLVVK